MATEQVLGVEAWENISSHYENHEHDITSDPAPSQFLLQELGSLIGDIPNMDSFKISDMPKEATMPEDNDRLFDGSPMSVSESALLWLLQFAISYPVWHCKICCLLLLYIVQNLASVLMN